MYPQGELTALAHAKFERRQAIARHRAQCTAAATAAIQPLVWLDRAWTLWRGLAPLVRAAAQPVGGGMARAIFSRSKAIGALLRWGPPVFQAVSAFRQMDRRASAPEPEAR